MSKTISQRCGNTACYLSSLLHPRGSRTEVFCKRQKHKKKWSSEAKKTLPTYLALEAFDGMYGQGAYSKIWPSVRLALLSMPKYCAVVNNFSANKAKVEENFLQLGAVPLESLIRPSTKANEVSDRSLPSQSLEVPESFSGVAQSEDLREGVKEEEPEFMPATKEVVGEEDELRTQRSGVPQLSSSHRHPVLKMPKDPALPYYLNAFVFPRGNITRFPSPGADHSGFSDYYCMNAASLLPAIAMDLRPGDNVLDLCAAPGGKSVVMLQTMLPGSLICNDESLSRAKRMEQVLRSFFPLNEFPGKVRVTNDDGLWYWTEEPFDKILVDVPCTTDRTACNDEDNNLFTSAKAGERMKLSQKQMDLLINACKAVKIGGSVVYSTCALSPTQNDGVIHMAIEQMNETKGPKMVVVDTSFVKEMFKRLFRFHNDPESYGQTVLPFLPNNFGPSYFARLVRIQ